MYNPLNDHRIWTVFGIAFLAAGPIVFVPFVFLSVLAVTTVLPVWAAYYIGKTIWVKLPRPRLTRGDAYIPPPAPTPDDLVAQAEAEHRKNVARIEATSLPDEDKVALRNQQDELLNAKLTELMR